MRHTVLVLFVFLASLTAHAADDDVDKVDHDDIGVGWKIGIGAAITTIALSGVVGAVMREPLEKAGFSDAISPSAVVIATASVGFTVGITLAILAEATRTTGD